MNNETNPMLTGTELLYKVDEMQSANATKTEIALACGYVRENGKPNFVDFYTELLNARGVSLEDSQDDDTEDNSLEAELIDRHGKDAVDAFLKIWSEGELDKFEEVYCGEYGSGAEYAREVVEECYGLELPSFVCIDWEETWQQLSYDYYMESGFIFRTY